MFQNFKVDETCSKIFQNLLKRSTINATDFRFLCHFAIDALSIESLVIHVKPPVVVVGDIRGHLRDLLYIIKCGGSIDETKYIFLGNYIDSSSFGIEVFAILMIFKIMFPKNITLLRGYHEVRQVNYDFGFRNEIIKKFGDVKLYEKVNEVFGYLPIVALINNGTVLCSHSGLPTQDISFNKLNGERKPVIVEDDSLIDRFLNSRLSYYIDCFDEFDSGIGIFGPGTTKRQFKSLSIRSLIRGHEFTKRGIWIDHDDRIITLLSAANYKDNNEGAIVHVDVTNEMVMSFIRFTKFDTRFYYQPISQFLGRRYQQGGVEHTCTNPNSWSVFKRLKKETLTEEHEAAKKQKLEMGKNNPPVNTESNTKPQNPTKSKKKVRFNTEESHQVNTALTHKEYREHLRRIEDMSNTAKDQPCGLRCAFEGCTPRCANPYWPKRTDIHGDSEESDKNPTLQEAESVSGWTQMMEVPPPISELYSAIQRKLSPYMEQVRAGCISTLGTME